jgi:serine O-acetyltransferase
MSQTNSNSIILFQKNLLEERNFIDKSKAENWLEQLFAWLFCTNQECVDFDLFLQKETQLKTDFESILSQAQVGDKGLVNDFFNHLRLIITLQTMINASISS